MNLIHRNDDIWQINSRLGHSISYYATLNSLVNVYHGDWQVDHWWEFNNDLLGGAQKWDQYKISFECSNLAAWSLMIDRLKSYARLWSYCAESRKSISSSNIKWPWVRWMSCRDAKELSKSLFGWSGPKWDSWFNHQKYRIIGWAWPILQQSRTIFWVGWPKSHRD